MYIVFTFYVAYTFWEREVRVGLRNWHGDMKSLLQFRARRKILDLHEEKQFVGRG